MNQPKRQQHVTSQAEWHQSYLAWWTLVNAVRFIHFICYYLIVFSCLASQPTYPMVFDWFTSTKDRKAILHPGLCKDSLFLGIAFTHPLLYSFQRCQSRWYIMPAIEQDHKRNTTVWRPFFFSFISVCVFAIFTPLVPNWFKPTQNHSRVYTHWRHKRNTSIWEHQHDIFIDRYVLCSFYSKYALIVHGLAMPFYYSRCILTDPQAEKKSVWEHQPTTSIDQYVPSLFNIINDEFILIYT